MPDVKLFLKFVVRVALLGFPEGYLLSWLQRLWQWLTFVIQACNYNSLAALSLHGPFCLLLDGCILALKFQTKAHSRERLVTSSIWEKSQQQSDWFDPHCGLSLGSNNQFFSTKWVSLGLNAWWLGHAGPCSHVVLLDAPHAQTHCWGKVHTAT